MKIKGIILALAVAAAVTSMVGCDDKKETVSRNDKKYESIAEESTIEESTESVENTDSTVGSANEDTEKSALQKAREEAANQAGDTESSSEQHTDEADGDTQKIAEELHKKSCETFWNTLINCSYQLDEADKSAIKQIVSSLCIRKGDV